MIDRRRRQVYDTLLQGGPRFPPHVWPIVIALWENLLLRGAR